MKHKLGLWSLVAAGIGSIIGSGWLFTAYKAAQYAGAGALIAWFVGAFIILLLALVIAEIATLHPKRGLFTRLLTISHNRDMGYITALANWLGIVAVIPTEAMATVQYLANMTPSTNQSLYANGHLSAIGLSLVTGLVLVYALLNFWGARLFAKSNNLITIFKVIVPVATALIIIYTAFHPGNFTAEEQQILPHGFSSIFAAIMSSGIIYAFNGFQSIASFCSEAKDPAHTIPRALVIAIIGSLLIYLLLQVAFIGGLPPQLLSNGWQGLSFQSPIAQLTSLLGLNFITLILYVDACISPSGTGIIYTGTTSRMLTAMAQERQAPQYFNQLHPVYHFSRRSLVFNIALSLGLLWFFPSWESLVVIVSLFHIISYLACPIALMRLRITEADKPRKFRLPAAEIICPLLFLFITFLFCLTPERDLLIVTGLLAGFYVSYILIFHKHNVYAIKKSIKRSYAIIAYFVILCFLGLLGNPHEGGYDLISHTTFYCLMVIISICFYYWLVYAKTWSPLPERKNK